MDWPEALRRMKIFETNAEAAIELAKVAIAEGRPELIRLVAKMERYDAAFRADLDDLRQRREPKYLPYVLEFNKIVDRILALDTEYILLVYRFFGRVMNEGKA